MFPEVYTVDVNGFGGGAEHACRRTGLPWGQLVPNQPVRLPRRGAGGFRVLGIEVLTS